MLFWGFSSQIHHSQAAVNMQYSHDYNGTWYSHLFVGSTYALNAQYENSDQDMHASG